MPFALFPAVAEHYGGAEVVGLLWAAPAVGAIVAMLTSGWSVRVHHNGRAIVFAAAGWGAFIALFGFADSLWLALLALAFAGAADAISGIFRGALWNETIPDRLRGRLAGLEMISWSSGPLLGNARAGFGGVAVRPRAVDRDRRRDGRRGVRARSRPRSRASGTTTREREAGAPPRR